MLTTKDFDLLAERRLNREETLSYITRSRNLFNRHLEELIELIDSKVVQVFYKRSTECHYLKIVFNAYSSEKDAESLDIIIEVALPLRKDGNLTNILMNLSDRLRTLHPQLSSQSISLETKVGLIGIIETYLLGNGFIAVREN